MRQFTLTIECDNAAFGDDDSAACAEINRIMRHLSARLEASELYPNSAQWIRDVNGNRVGTYKYEVR
jgi:hypothetical protein